MRLIGSLVLLFTLLNTTAWGQSPPPESPGEADWAFLQDLQTPQPWRVHWDRELPAPGEVSLKAGVRIETSFPDPEGLLDTAHEELNRFFRDITLPLDGPYQIVTERTETSRFEAFRVVIEADTCRVQAADSEGIRRGLYWVIDELLRANGPFLKAGTVEREPHIATRISRCFFGPIKRPPKNKDELMDEVNYYPEAYLAKIARDGVNGLWLTIEFKDLVKTSLTEHVDPGREQRLAKLRETVARCRRYGIDVYVFCIEPRVMDPDHPLLQAHPEIGSPTPGTGRLFCPFPETAQRYLYEAVNDIFTQVPHLGGLINISFGERSTTCLSGADETWKLLCPTCKEKSPGEILRASLTAMEQGMHAANRKAKFISWLYVPQNGTGPQRDLEPIRDMARHTPEGVICQVNFESGGELEQLGKPRHAGDYWLSYVGPSALYINAAGGVAESQGALGAKLQACNSFEVSTTPYVPVPGNLFRKYGEMRRLGVESVMQCWYIGSLPSMMNRAAATDLVFAPEGESEDDFLQALAAREWGPKGAPHAVRAWKAFAEAYRHYPLTNAFQYFGPMHDGIVWPLHLKPAHLNLSPVWKLEYPPSGDRIGECISGSHTLEEAIELCRRVSEGWRAGLEALAPLKEVAANDPARRQDLAVAEALGLQFSTGYNLLRFYALRDKLLYGPEGERQQHLDALRAIATAELENTRAMEALCAINPYLGFQAEAEGYKYFPERLQWRATQIETMLSTEFPEAERAIAAGESPFAVQAGRAEVPYRHIAPDGFGANWTVLDAWSEIPTVAGPHEPAWTWSATSDDDALYFQVRAESSPDWRPVEATVHIEPSFIYPRRTFRAGPGGKRDLRTVWLGPDADWTAAGEVREGVQHFTFRIPREAFASEAAPEKPMRINVQLTFLSADKRKNMVRSWLPAAEPPLLHRLGFGRTDPREMGWLVLENRG
jgi:hypothetical protein